MQSTDTVDNKNIIKDDIKKIDEALLKKIALISKDMLNNDSWYPDKATTAQKNQEILKISKTQYGNLREFITNMSLKEETFLLSYIKKQEEKIEKFINLFDNFITQANEDKPDKEKGKLCAALGNSIRSFKSELDEQINSFDSNLEKEREDIKHREENEPEGINQAQTEANKEGGLDFDSTEVNLTQRNVNTEDINPEYSKEYNEHKEDYSKNLKSSWYQLGAFNYEKIFKDAEPQKIEFTTPPDTDNSINKNVAKEATITLPDNGTTPRNSTGPNNGRTLKVQISKDGNLLINVGNDPSILNKYCINIKIPVKNKDGKVVTRLEIAILNGKAVMRSPDPSKVTTKDGKAYYNNCPIGLSEEVFHSLAAATKMTKDAHKDHQMHKKAVGHTQAAFYAMSQEAKGNKVDRGVKEAFEQHPIMGPLTKKNHDNCLAKAQDQRQSRSQ